MRRLHFLRSLLALPAAATLATAAPAVTGKQKVYYYRGFVRGLLHHAGPGLLAQKQLVEGVALVLKAEPGNAHDPNAIAVWVGKCKLGYVPREDNAVLSLMVRAGTPQLHAELTHINPDAKQWQTLHIGIYTWLEGKTPQDAITTVDAPLYDGRYSRLHSDDDWEMAEPPVVFASRRALPVTTFTGAASGHARIKVKVKSINNNLTQWPDQADALIAGIDTSVHATERAVLATEQAVLATEAQTLGWSSKLKNLVNLLG